MNRSLAVTVLILSLISLFTISLPIATGVEIETEKDQYLQGESIDIHVDGIEDMVTIQISKDDDVLLLYTLEPNDGSIDFNFTIPENWVGQYKIWISNEFIYDNHEVIIKEKNNPEKKTDESEPDIPTFFTIAGIGFFVALTGGGALSSTEAGRYKALMAIAPLFSRLRDDDILNQETRWKILGAVYAQPGITYSDLKRKLNLNNGTLIHHTDVLIKDRRIVTRLDGSRRRYFSISMKKSTASLIPGPHIKKNQIEILAYIEEYPGYTQKQIAKGLKISQSRLSYNLQKLEEMGYIEVLKEKRNRYFLKGGPQSFSCSNCHNQFSSELEPLFCPRCGSSMDKKNIDTGNSRMRYGRVGGK